MAQIEDLLLGRMDNVITLSGDFAQMMYNICNGSTSNMANINNAGGVHGWIIPDYDKCHLIGNSLRFVVCQIWYAVGDYATIPADAPKAKVSGMDTYFYIDTTYRGEFSCSVRDVNGVTVTLKSDGMKTNYKGVLIYEGGAFAGAQFDVAFFARNYFKRLPWLYGTMFTKIFFSPLLDNTPIYVFNGVAQQGESSQKDWLSGGIADQYTYILLSRQVVVMPWESEVSDADNRPMISVLVRYSTGASMVLSEQFFTPMTATDVADLNAMLGSNVIKFQPVCGGIAVRWINDLGGIDSYVFPLRNAKKRKAKTKGWIDVYSPDPYDVKDTLKIYDIEVGDTIKVGVDNMPREIYEALQYLAISPSIAMYFPNVSVPENRWQAVSVETCEVTENEESNSMHYEITFNLPKPNLQL